MNTQKIDLNELAKVLAEKARGRALTPQSVFITLAKECGLKIRVRDAQKSFAQVQPIVKKLVDEGLLTYYHDSENPRYIVAGKSTTLPVYRTPEHGNIRRFNNRGEGETALKLMSQRPFFVDKEAVTAELTKAEADLGALPQLYKDRVLGADEFSTEKERLTLLCIQLRTLQCFAGDDPVYFPTFADYRGRLYFGGGIASPHNGKFARELFMRSEEKALGVKMITLDCRSSFAQMICILTGNTALGKLCGIGTTAEADLYVGFGTQAGLSEDRAKALRETLKQIIMPSAYGAGTGVVDRAIEGTDISDEEKKSLKELTDQYFGALRTKVQKIAKEFADDGDQLEWVTPSANIPRQKYWQKRSVQYVTGDCSGIYYPPAFALQLECSLVQTNKDEHSAGAVVGATANVIQSLDASFCSLVINRFFERFGYVPFTVHDSFCVREEHADELRAIASDVLRYMADCEEMKELRKLLRLPARTMNLVEMNPLDIE